jgi:hypothetical protein
MMNSTIVKAVNKFLRDRAKSNSFMKLVAKLSDIPKILKIDQQAFESDIRVILEIAYESKLPATVNHLLLDAVIKKDCAVSVNEDLLNSINLLRPKWKKTLNAHEVLRIDLLEPEYTTTENYKKPKLLSSTHSFSFQAPLKVIEWSNFTQSCLTWLSTQDFNFKVNVPPGYKTLIYGYFELREFVRGNLFMFSKACMKSKTRFVSFQDDDRVEGKPDFVMIRDKEIVAPVVIRGSWILDKPNFLNLYQPGKDKSVISAINELYHYMRINFRQYGILTTYEITVFLKREIIDGQDVLYITQDIPYTRNIQPSKNAFSISIQ